MTSFLERRDGSPTSTFDAAPPRSCLHAGHRDEGRSAIPDGRRPGTAERPCTTNIPWSSLVRHTRSSVVQTSTPDKMSRSLPAIRDSPHAPPPRPPPDPDDRRGGRGVGAISQGGVGQAG